MPPLPTTAPAPTTPTLAQATAQTSPWTALSAALTGMFTTRPATWNTGLAGRVSVSLSVCGKRGGGGLVSVGGGGACGGGMCLWKEEGVSLRV